MENLYDTERSLEDAIIHHDNEHDGGNAILTGWVLVAEWIDKDGEPNLTAYAKTGMPFWRIDGLLAAGENAMNYAPEVE